MIYFHSCIWIGTFIIIELFLAVLLGTFDQIFAQEKQNKAMGGKEGGKSGSGVKVRA